MSLEEKEKLWLSVLPLMIKVATQMWRKRPRTNGKSMELEDYRQVALMAAWESLRTWDPAKGALTTHAVHWARGYILKHSHDDDLIRYHVGSQYSRTSRGLPPFARTKLVAGDVGELHLRLRQEPDTRHLEDADEVRRVLECLLPSERRLAEQVLAGKTCREIDLERGSRGKRPGRSAYNQLRIGLNRVRQMLAREH